VPPPRAEWEPQHRNDADHYKQLDQQGQRKRDIRNVPFTLPPVDYLANNSSQNMIAPQIKTAEASAAVTISQ